MAKIVALGGGRFDNGELDGVLRHITKLSGKNRPAFLFLPAAGYDDVSADKALLDSFLKCGCTRDILYLTREDVTNEIIARKIMGSDIIYAGGGNLKFLMDVCRRTKADVYLKKAYEADKVLCGHSSGAMCWFQEGFDDCGENHSFMFYGGLGFLPFTSCPHYQSEYWRSFERAIKGRSLSGIAMDNGAAFCFDGGRYYTICGSEGGDCYFYDADRAFSKINLRENPDLLKSLPQR